MMDLSEIFMANLRPPLASDVLDCPPGRAKGAAADAERSVSSNNENMKKSGVHRNTDDDSRVCHYKVPEFNIPHEVFYIPNVNLYAASDSHCSDRWNGQNEHRYVAPAYSRSIYTRAATACSGERFWNEEYSKEQFVHKFPVLAQGFHFTREEKLRIDVGYSQEDSFGLTPMIPQSFQCRESTGDVPRYTECIHCFQIAKASRVINPNATMASKNTYFWLLAHGIDTLFTPESYSKFVDADFPGLASRIYVDAQPRLIDWACKFFTWLCVVDDQLSNQLPNAADPEASLPLFLDLHLVLLYSYPQDVAQDRFLEFLDAFPFSPGMQEKLLKLLDALSYSDLREDNLGTFDNRDFDVDCERAMAVYEGELGPLGSCFRDLWSYSVQEMPADFNSRLASSIQLFILGKLAEVRTREKKTAEVARGNGVPLDVSTYTSIVSKRHGVKLTLIIVDLIDEVSLGRVPTTVFGSNSMQNLIRTMNDILVWHHDLFAFKETFFRGDPYNLVYLIGQERKCSFTEASLVVREMVYNRIFDLDNIFGVMLKEAESAPCDTQYSESLIIEIQKANNQKAVERYIQTCHSWICATQSWHLNRAGYQ